MLTQLSTSKIAAPKTDPSSTAGWIFETIVLVTIAVAVAMLIKIFLIQPYVIPTGSMLPTIQLKDFILANKLVVWTGYEPKHGDIIVFKDPSEELPLLVKRVIATEGQTIDLRDGDVYIDGEKLDEPYVHGLPTRPQVYSYPYTVPKDHVWTMGDNRENSGDSRSYGPVDEKLIQGRAFFTYWPIKNIGKLE